MQGIFIKGVRPKSKKAIREAAAEQPAAIRIEATSVFGNEYDGPADSLPVGSTVVFAGPDPFADRRFYGQITRKADGTVTVK